MRNLEKDQRKIIKKIRHKIDFAIERINNDTDSEYVCYNRLMFFNLKVAMIEIKQLLNKITNQNESVDSINRTLLDIALIIDINEKYYDDESK